MAITWESITSGAGLGLGSSGDVWAQLARAINDRRAAVNLGATNFSYLGTSPANGSALDGEPIVEATKTLIDEMAVSLQAAVTGSSAIKFTDSDWSTYTGAGSVSDGDVADGSYTSAHTGGFRGAIVRFREVIDDLIYIESKPSVSTPAANGTKTNTATPSFSGSGGTVASIAAPGVGNLNSGGNAEYLSMEYFGTPLLAPPSDHAYTFVRRLHKREYTQNWRSGKTVSEIKFTSGTTSSYTTDTTFANGSFSASSMMTMAGELFLCSSAQYSAATYNTSPAGTSLRTWDNSAMVTGPNIFGSLDISSEYVTTPGGNIYFVFEPSVNSLNDDPFPALTMPSDFSKWEHSSSSRASTGGSFRIKREWGITSLTATLAVRYQDPPSD